jgi:hypothetical protein
VYKAACGGAQIAVIKEIASKPCVKSKPEKFDREMHWTAFIAIGAVAAIITRYAVHMGLRTMRGGTSCDSQSLDSAHPLRETPPVYRNVNFI